MRCSELSTLELLTTHYSLLTTYYLLLTTYLLLAHTRCCGVEQSAGGRKATARTTGAGARAASATFARGAILITTCPRTACTFPTAATAIAAGTTT